jgi:hypothetical protein
MARPGSTVDEIATKSHPLRAVRQAAVWEARLQIARLEALDLSDEDGYHRRLVGLWIRELRRSAQRPVR